MKAFRNIMRYFKGNANERPEVKTNQRSKPIVEKKDIIEAEFEDITDDKE
jgi:hypothetical protein